MDGLVNHPRYGELLSALDSGEAWRALADIGDEYGTVLQPADLAQAQRRPSPARYLLERICTLLDQPLTAEETVLLLEPLDGPAAAAAELLRPPQPLCVRPLAETNSACVWVPLGGRLLLRCEAVARPPPSYRWRRDGQPVAPAAGGHSAELSVQPFSAADAGGYSCEVQDAAGVSLHAGTVCVQPQQTPPRQLSRQVLSGGTLSDAGVVHAPGGRPLRLQVRWSGWPEPQLRWTHDGRPVTCGADGDTLTLQSVTEMADGAYVCVANNAVGEMKSDPFPVRVDQRPTILTHPEAPLSHHPIGRPLKLRSSAFCRRQVKVVWRRRLLDEDGGRDTAVVLPPSQVYTEWGADGVVHSEVTLELTAREARHMCSVHCEFVAAGDFENSYSQSNPAKFRVVYSAHSKMALIIGNSKYEHLIQLPEVTQDVANFTEAMHHLGFGTLVAMNLTTEKSRRLVEYFASVAAPGAYLVVMVAGHGFTHQRQDYLAPVDHPPLEGSAGADPSRCLSMLDDIEHRLQRTSPKVVVICGDTCRTRSEVSPTAAAAGPEPVHPPTSAPNVVRLFSTQMGHEAMDDSKFMRCLLKNIQRDITVQQLSLRTLRESRETDDQIPQHPIVELSIADRRSLLDPADNTTALDCTVYRSYRLQSSVVNRLEARWSNYLWDATPELLLTVRLCDAQDGFYVERVVASDNRLTVRLESGDTSSPVSSWRVLGLPAGGGCVSPELVVLISRWTTPSGPQLGCRLDCQQLRLHERLGLVGGVDVAAPPPADTAQGRKISNVPDAADW